MRSISTGGIHDLKFMLDGKRQVEAEDYEKILRAVVTWMKTNGAKLTNLLRSWRITASR